MTITKEEFKKEVTQLFADGKALTDDMFTRLADLVNQLTDSIENTPKAAGGVKVELVGTSARRIGDKWESMTVDTVTAEDGTTTIRIDAAPWFGTYFREFNFEGPITFGMRAQRVDYYKDAFISNSINKFLTPYAIRYMVNGARAIYGIDTTNLDAEKFKQITGDSTASLILPIESESGIATINSGQTMTLKKSVGNPKPFDGGASEQVLSETNHGTLVDPDNGEWELTYHLDGQAKFDSTNHIEYGQTLVITGAVFKSTNGQIAYI